jgi:hypothetical protein
VHAGRYTNDIIGIIRMGPPVMTCLTRAESAWSLDNAPELKEADAHMRDAPALPIYEAYRLNQAVRITVQQGCVALKSRTFGEKTLASVNKMLEQGRFIRTR